MRAEWIHAAGISKKYQWRPVPIRNVWRAMLGCLAAHNDSLPQLQRLGADGGAEAVGDVIRADAPSHCKAEAHVRTPSECKTCMRACLEVRIACSM